MNDEIIRKLSEEDRRIVQDLIERGKINLNSKDIAELFPLFVDLEKRMETEIPFLLKQLRKYKSPVVFDSCLGSGATSIGLKLHGIEVVSNEISDDFLEVALEEAEKYGVRLNITKFDWRELAERLFMKFDVVTNLGNSLTLLFKREDQLEALRNFYDILKPGGTLIIDERNYREYFLKGHGSNYKWSGKVIYCGVDKVDAYPVYVSQTMVIMEYKIKKSGKKTHVIMYPFKEGELIGLLYETGFTGVEVYGDYELYDPTKKPPEFFTYVGKRES